MKDVKQALKAKNLPTPSLGECIAASVDGYTSFGSVLLKGGFNQTLPSEAPRCKELRVKVLEQIMPYSELRKMFAKAGCPVLPDEVGLSCAALIACTHRAQMIRYWYNSLDLAWDLDCFGTVLAKLENSTKYFC